MSVRLSARPGFTLLELIVTIALVALMTAIAIPGNVSRRVAAGGTQRTIDSLVVIATRSGQSFHSTISDGRNAAEVTVLPNGIVIADSVLGIDPVSGRMAP